MFAVSGGAADSEAPTDFSACRHAESEKAFFAALKKDSAREAAAALTGQACAAGRENSDAFRQGFSDAFEARKYLSTFGRYKLHYSSMTRIEESQRACLEKEAKSPEARACCMLGYARGEAAFKKRLRSSEAIPSQCAEEFARGARDGRNQCDPDCEEHPLPETFECDAICYSFGWNESFAPCLKETFADERDPQGRSNRAIDFISAYAPAASGSGARGSPASPSKAGTAK